MAFTPSRSLGEVIRYTTLASALMMPGCKKYLGHLFGVDGGYDAEISDLMPSGTDAESPDSMPPPPFDEDVDVRRSKDLGPDALRPDVYSNPDAPPDAPPDAGLDARVADAAVPTPDTTPPTPDVGPDTRVADAAVPTPDTVPPASDAIIGSDSGGIPFLEDLIAMWLFDEPLGGDSSIIDSSGNGYAGTVESATRITGRRGNAIDFNTVSDPSAARVNIPGVPAFGADSSFTFSAWYQVRSYDSGAGGGNTLAQLARLAGDYNFDIRFHQGRLQFNFVNADLINASVWQSDETFTIPTSDPDAGTESAPWHKLDIVFTYGDASSFRAYRDGTLIAGSWGETDGSAAPYVPPETFLTIGAYRQGGSYSQEFDGVVDEVRLYDRALLEAELLDLYDDEL